ncbi:MAG: DUF262 domain-containing protein [Spirochaetaceae bacterium]|nr:DUF262 domain-containing protein [Spirochaetaceae bacterium]
MLGHENPKLGTFLSDIYHIPSYQRKYAWTQIELDDFWEDIMSVFKGDEQNHFFGQVVIYKYTNPDDDSISTKYIIDGQQRITTSYIFLKVLHNAYKNLLPLLNNDDDLMEQSVLVKNLIFYEKKPRLHQNKSDNTFFSKQILDSDPTEIKCEESKSKENLRYAYYFLNDKLVKTLETNTSLSEKTDTLNKLFLVIKDKFHILSVTTTNLNEAFIIFETLNARGKGLETADLLKNYLFEKSNSSEDEDFEAENVWNEMIDNLGQIDPTKYIRDFWNSRHTLTREKALYKAIQDEIKHSNNKSEELLQELLNYSSIYANILIPENSVEIKEREVLKPLKSIKTLGITTFHTLILSMYENDFNPNTDIAMVLNCLEKYLFRNFTICHGNPNDNEKKLARIAVDISNKNLTTARDVCKEILAGELVSDTSFIEAFSKWSSKDRDICHYILRKINNYLNSSQEINTPQDVNLEHIMPIKYKKYWQEVEDYHKEYVWRLGNLTILGQEYNKKIKNHKYVDKVEEYKKSDLEINKQFLYKNTELIFPRWDKNSIEIRQNALAEIAVKIWNDERND